MSAQSLALEMHYHNLCMNLYRPFISFNRVSDSTTPLTEQHAISCVNHAITNTNIIHQILTESDNTTGSHSLFQWQWNATLSVIGYLLAYPTSPTTSAARKALNTAIHIFEFFSSHCASALSAAKLSRDLSVKIDALIDRHRRPSSSHSQVTQSFSPFLDTTSDGFDGANTDFLRSLTEDESAAFQNTLSNMGGFAFSFDTINGLGDLGMDGANAFDWLDFGDVPGP